MQSGVLVDGTRRIARSANRLKRCCAAATNYAPRGRAVQKERAEHEWTSPTSARRRRRRPRPLNWPSTRRAITSSCSLHCFRRRSAASKEEDEEEKPQEEDDDGTESDEDIEKEVVLTEKDQPRQRYDVIAIRTVIRGAANWQQV